MYEQLFYENEKGEKIEFSPYSTFHTSVKRNVSGLRDVSARIITSETAGMDGASYEGTQIEMRDIEITGWIRRNNLDEQKRLARQLNKIMNPRFSGTLIYQYGDYRRYIKCHPETAPAYKYDAGTWTEFNIVLKCPWPYWQEETERTAEITSWMGGMIFDAEEGLEIAEDWEIGYRMPELIVAVENDGDTPIGMTVRFAANGDVETPKILDVETGEYIKLNLSMVKGDVVEVTTGFGDKRVMLHSGGETTNIFRMLEAGSTFLQLDVGTTRYKVEAASGIEDLDVSLKYRNIYTGV